MSPQACGGCNRSEISRVVAFPGHHHVIFRSSAAAWEGRRAAPGVWKQVLVARGAGTGGAGCAAAASAALACLAAGRRKRGEHFVNVPALAVRAFRTATFGHRAEQFLELLAAHVTGKLVQGHVCGLLCGLDPLRPACILYIRGVSLKQERSRKWPPPGVWQVFLAGAGGCSARTGGRWRRRQPGCVRTDATAKPQEIVPCRKSLPQCAACRDRNKPSLPTEDAVKYGVLWWRGRGLE